MGNLRKATRYEMAQIIERLSKANLELRAENSALRTQIEVLKTYTQGDRHEPSRLSQQH